MADEENDLIKRLSKLEGKIKRHEAVLINMSQVIKTMGAVIGRALHEQQDAIAKIAAQSAELKGVDATDDMLENILTLSNKSSDE